MDKERQQVLKRHLDKLGVAGAIFATLCCLGVPALVSIVSSIGLGFLINDTILLPLLIVFLVAAVGGLIFGVRHHHRRSAVVVGVISAVMLVLAMSVVHVRLLIWVGIGGLIVASLLNVVLRQRQFHEKRSATA